MVFLNMKYLELETWNNTNSPDKWSMLHYAMHIHYYKASVQGIHTYIVNRGIKWQV